MDEYNTVPTEMYVDNIAPVEAAEPLPIAPLQEPSPLTLPVVESVLPTPEEPAIFSAPEDPLPAPLPESPPEQPLPLPDAQPEMPEEEPAPQPEEVPAEDTPAEQPVAETSLDDLFDPIEPTEPAETPEQDDTPEQEQEPAEQPAEEPAEQAAEKTEEDETKEPVEEDKELSFEDIFGSHLRPATLRKPGGLDSTLLRTWSDNTGRFGCQARLLRVTTKAVVLQRTAGQDSRVALSRLSDADLRFVRRQVVAQRKQLAARQVVEKLSVAWVD